MNKFIDKKEFLKDIKNLKIGIIGFGSQGKSQALNLRDSGLNVSIGLQEKSKSKEIAEKLEFHVTSVSDLTQNSDILVFLFPDEKHEEVYQNDIKPFLRKGQIFIFAHGFSIFYKKIEYPNWINVGMISPKGIGPALREEYLNKGSVPCLLAIENSYMERSSFKKILLAYAAGIGTFSEKIFETHFQEECEADLFGEQAALCGGLAALIQSSYETLIENGYKEEVAYFECIHELKFIVDLIYHYGLSYTFNKISNTAKYGALLHIDAFKKILKPHMQEILKKIQNKDFMKAWDLENKNSKKNLKNLLEKDIFSHPLEKKSDALRKKILIKTKDL